MFYVGQKVVCVDATWSRDQSPLVEEQVYTVMRLAVNNVVGGYYIGKFDKPGEDLILHEIVNAHSCTGGFAVDRFRPITDISVFTAMLDHQPLFKPAREDA